MKSKAIATVKSKGKIIIAHTDISPLEALKDSAKSPISVAVSNLAK